MSKEELLELAQSDESVEIMRLLEEFVMDNKISLEKLQEYAVLVSMEHYEKEYISKNKEWKIKDIMGIKVFIGYTSLFEKYEIKKIPQNQKENQEYLNITEFRKSQYEDYKHIKEFFKINDLEKIIKCLVELDNWDWGFNLVEQEYEKRFSGGYQ